MDFRRFFIDLIGQEQQEIAIAFLEETTLETFENAEEGLYAYTNDEKISEAEIQTILFDYGLEAMVQELEPVKKQNWNALWEANFKPVYISEKLGIRAPFHEPQAVEMELIILPKMSFGTGHHQTTAMMSTMILDLDLHGKKVLDFGSGTGILAIICAKRGASEVIAIDNEPWAVQNCIENAYQNEVTEMTCLLGEKEHIPNHSFDIVLANINKHIILDAIHVLVDRCAKNGIILVSGILNSDEEDIIAAFAALGLSKVKTVQKDQWSAIQFIK
jgi:ribosomal protein L11 methyltransferase